MKEIKKQIIITICFLFGLLGCSPKYIDVGDSLCTDHEDNYTKEVYYDNNSIKKRSHYTKGSLDSLVSYYMNGQKTSVMRFASGDIDGESRSYYSNGALKSTITFKNNVEVYNSRKEYDSLGNELFKLTENGNQSIYESKYPTVEKKWLVNYKNKLVNGEYIQWRKDGSIIIKYQYKDGKHVPDNYEIYDAEGRDVAALVRYVLINEASELTKIYNSYLKHNIGLSGKIKVFLMIDPVEKKMKSYLLNSDMECQELTENLNDFIMYQKYEPLTLTGEEYFSFIIPYVFAYK